MSGNGSSKREGQGKGLFCVLALVLSVMVSSRRVGAQAPSSARNEDSPRITLRVYNYGVSPSALTRAEGVATTILNRAGLEVAWTDCPLNPADFGSYPACQRPAGADDFAVKILTAKGAERFSAHHEAMGQALECPADQAGCAAYIFYRDVLELARAGDASEYQLLGHALAHEIGHLLLGPNSNTATGIMRATWSQRDLEVIARGYMLFTEQQSNRMRNVALERNTVELDRIADAQKP